VGGAANFVARAPEGFLAPTADEFTYSFLFLWFWIGFFRYAADWAFVQRYICVPTPRDAQKAAYLMGGLYVVSPILWMLPAMVYRVIDPDAKPEEAYMLVCCRVLPAGMLGIMVAAMFSATASMVSSVLNVFAGVFTCDVYKALINPAASPRRMVAVGRLATLFYGIAMILVALSVPYMGGAEKLVLVLVMVLLGPLMVPVIWALYSRHVGPCSIWATLAICTPAAILAESAPALISRYGETFVPQWLTRAIHWVEANPRETEGLLGLVLPLAVLGAVEAFSRLRGVDPGWNRMQEAFAHARESGSAAVASLLPARIVAASLGMLGLLMMVITIRSAQQRSTLAAFTVLLLISAAGMAWLGFRKPKAEVHEIS